MAKAMIYDEKFDEMKEAAKGEASGAGEESARERQNEAKRRTTVLHLKFSSIYLYPGLSSQPAANS